jgi:hypothetical protein
MDYLEFYYPSGQLVSLKVGEENKELFSIIGTVEIILTHHKMRELTTLSFTSFITKTLTHSKKFLRLLHIGEED